MAENDIWTIQSALDWTVGYLERKGDANPRISAQWLMSETCGMSRIELYANFDKPLSLEEREVLRGFVTRRGRGEPLQYITGEVAFRHITVKVKPGVLIPRPETEVLVSEVLALLPAAPRPRAKEEPPLEVTDEQGVQGNEQETASEVEPQPLLVADVCTGSGCIACSLAFEHPLIQVFATDIAPEAVALARENVQLLGLDGRVEVLECDMGEGIEAAHLGSFDAVVSNPPYVPTGVLATIPREVSDFEPALALDGGTDGLDAFRRLVLWAFRALKPGGVFAVELHETCLDEAEQLACAAGFSEMRIVDDLAGRPRILTYCRR